MARQENYLYQEAELHVKHTNGFVERFHQIALEEFFKKSLQSKFYTSIEKLQTDFDQWLHYYNYQRPHKGYRNMSLPPATIYQNYFNLLTH